MKAKVTFADKPFPHTPVATGRQTYTGELKGEILWCEEQGHRFGIHTASRAVIIPLEPVEAPVTAAQAKEHPAAKAQAKGAA